ncbi:MAG: sulfotransferase [Isosphaeraceae bacterium]
MNSVHAEIDARHDPSPRRFFIAGSQRSGTTLVRLVLGSHPDICCYDEVDGYAALAEGSCSDVARLVGFKVPMWTEMLGEECPADPRAAGVYRGEPIVFLLRDVRDTVASMLRLRSTATQSWLAAWGRPILEGAIASRPGFTGRFAREIARLRELSEPEVAVGALYWKFKTIAYFDHLDRGRPVCPLRYERLTADPEPELRQVLDFLGLPWDPAVLDHPRMAHREVFEDGLTVGHTNPNRAIDMGSVGLWRGAFSADDERILLEIAGDLNERITALDAA